MKVIYTNKKEEIFVDDDLYDDLAGYTWYLDIGGYAIRRVNKGTVNGKRIRPMVRIHRQIINPPSHIFVDHINGNRLDNRRINLRLATNQQNQRNSKVTTRNKYGYKGVTKDTDPRYKKIWRMCTHAPDGRQVVFHFDTPQEAARKYDELNREWFGDFALTNEALGLL